MHTDLRLQDHPALFACSQSGPVIPIWIYDEKADPCWKSGKPTKWWLSQSLHQLARSLSSMGSRLTVREGDTSDELIKLAEETNASQVCWNRPQSNRNRQIASTLKQALKAKKIRQHEYEGDEVFPDHLFILQDGSLRQTFTPFWKSCQQSMSIKKPVGMPSKFIAPTEWPTSVLSKILNPLPASRGLDKVWNPGTHGAQSKLDQFFRDAIGQYAENRDRLDLKASSQLSAHIRFGEMSVRRIWHEIEQAKKDNPLIQISSIAFQRQLAWREFAYFLLYAQPESELHPIKGEYDHFPWRYASDSILNSWRSGQTGYPIVDAAMRQLNEQAWISNRARMVVSSFLVKHLLIAWQIGAQWFWEQLIDADPANNTLGWQWTSGTGVDSAPYFRIFNPTLQGERFDPSGRYVRRWVPELAQLPNEAIHAPNTASTEVLAKAKVRLGDTYPSPIVDHKQARIRALSAFQKMREASKGTHY